MSDKVQLLTSSWCRSMATPNFTVWWWVHVSKDFVLVSLSSAAGDTVSANTCFIRYLTILSNLHCLCTEFN